MIVIVNQNQKDILTTHKNKNNYYNFSLGINSVIGNTAALMMIYKKVFVKYGMFNESYRHCFEDVELNLKIKIGGFKNLTNSNCVAHHLESATREIKKGEIEMTEDYNKLFLPFLKRNFDKLLNEIYILK